MEYLIRRGVPQRTAHGLIGQLVAMARKRGVPLAELPLEEFRRAHAELDERVFAVLGVRNAVEAMVSHGSTGPEQVRQQMARWKERLGEKGDD